MLLPSSVLFCCTMNEVRSAMAEGIMKRFHGNRVYVDSVGAHVSDRLDPLMLEVMKEIGVDMSRHRPKTFDALTDDSFDLAIALSPEAEALAADVTRYIDCDVRRWNVPDPTAAEGSREARLAAYRQVREQIQHQILDLFPLSDHPDF